MSKIEKGNKYIHTILCYYWFNLRAICYLLCIHLQGIKQRIQYFFSVTIVAFRYYFQEHNIFAKYYHTLRNKSNANFARTV